MIANMIMNTSNYKERSLDRRHVYGSFRRSDTIKICQFVESSEDRLDIGGLQAYIFGILGPNNPIIIKLFHDVSEF
jgi:hypothetical protein